VQGLVGSMMCEEISGLSPISVCGSLIGVLRQRRRHASPSIMFLRFLTCRLCLHWSPHQTGWHWPT